MWMMFANWNIVCKLVCKISWCVCKLVDVQCDYQFWMVFNLQIFCKLKTMFANFITFHLMKETINYFNTLYEMYANNEDSTLKWYFAIGCTSICANACLQTSKHGAIIHILQCKYSSKYVWKVCKFLKQSCIKMVDFWRYWISWKSKICKNAINVCKLSTSICKKT